MPKRELWRKLRAPLALLVLVMACGSPSTSSTGGGTSDTGSGDVAVQLDGHDGTSGDSKDGNGVTDASDTGPETVGDATPGDGDGGEIDSGGGCEFSKTPAPGEAGSVCTTNADCDSGVCVDGAEGKICTSVCVSCCPAGYSCAKAPGVDATYVCMPVQLALCAPCNKDAECSALDSGALCLGYGAAGHFCGAACAADSDCPSGYGCKQAAGQAGQGKQCVKSDNTCGCSKLASFKGAATTCTQTNSIGTCSGSRKCTQTGLTACDAPAPATEVCNGVDDDCDGSTDGAGATGCTPYFQDSDGDGYGSTSLGCLCSAPAQSATQGGDCNDTQPTVNPGAKEVCDGVDNDCNGKTDEGFPDANGDGIADCVDGDEDGDGVINALDCSPTNAAIHPGAQELCDGLDNDCNGVTDDAGAIGCTTWYLDGDSDSYGGSKAACLCGATGNYTAVTATDCDDTDASIHPGAAEVCNGKDDDCDGLTDAQDPKMVLTPCGLQAGVCAGALHVPSACVDGAFLACTAGDYTAYAAKVANAPAYNDGAEIACDGADNDCDGKTDEDFISAGPDGASYVGIGIACGVGACAGGVTQCNPAQTATLCSTATATSAEVCDGLDNDCDGVTDAADAELVLAPCEKQAGVCSGANHPANLCVAGSWQVCGNAVYALHAGNYQADTEQTCDGADNDCDGKTDEDFSFTGPDATTVQGAGVACGAGACAGGITVCSSDGSGIVCGSATQSAAEICDGKDNDCDGLTDAADPDLVAVPCDNQAGACAGSMRPTALCLNGSWQDCSAGDYLAQSSDFHANFETKCDGKDNDCDGKTDEDFSYLQLSGTSVQGAGSACGVGACAGGVTACNPTQDGLVCAAESGVSAEVCDGIDNDCNGKTDAADSALVVTPCEKQQGVCANAQHAASECIQGSWAACTAVQYGGAYESGATEAVCDGLDGNCNGLTDDIVVYPANANQLGACLGTTKVCKGVNGFVDDYASVTGYGLYEEPDASFLDENCDGIDGTVAGGLFVSPTGVDTGTCAKSAPCKTLPYAISLASGTANQDIYVMSGTYGAFTIDKGYVRIYGGFDANWSRADRNLGGHKVTFVGGLDATDQQYVTVKVRAVEVHLADLVLQGVDAIGTVAGAGRSSYVVHAKNANRLDIRRCDFVQANGAPGDPGLSGTSASSAAAPSGSNGGNASQYSTTCDSGSHGNGGGGASNGGCVGATGGGTGGNGGTMDTNCGIFSLNLNARPGTDGSASAAGASFGAAGGTCSGAGPGSPGGHTNGAGGVGATSANGVLSADYWAGNAGSIAFPGSVGQGGGGGGGSGGCETGTDSYGAGGGGGGAGGCAAVSPAYGGGAGGSSFGLVVTNTSATPITYLVESCVFLRGNGGNGGAGGVGGRGQSGGAGGTGGLGAGGSQPGGPGGAGGHGGHGGGGGGGAGGMSVGVFAQATASGMLTGLSYVGGTGGAGGAGGASAPTAPLSEMDGSPGTKGVDGTLGGSMTCALPGGC